MKIETWSTKGGEPWSTFTRGHVGYDDFVAACVNDEVVRQDIVARAKLDSGDVTPGFVKLRTHHLYMRAGTVVGRENQSACDERGEVWDWCLSYAAGAIPVTAFSYDLYPGN